MGLFSKLVDNFKNQTQAVFDPAGSLARKAFGNTDRNARSFIDPSGKLIQKPQDPTAPVQRAGYVSHLSPGAQALKDQMMARRQQQMNPSPIAPQVAPAPVMPPTGIPRPVMVAPKPPQQVEALQVTPQMDQNGFGLGFGYKDGGKVKKRKGYADGGQVKANPSSKVFIRKPNGKPY